MNERAAVRGLQKKKNPSRNHDNSQDNMVLYGQLIAKNVEEGPLYI